MHFNLLSLASKIFFSALFLPNCALYHQHHIPLCPTVHDLFQLRTQSLSSTWKKEKRRRVWLQTHTYKSHLSTVELCYR